MRRSLPSSAARTLPGGAPGKHEPEIGTRAVVYLHPGHLVVAPEPAAISTVLGSCVAVCLHDTAARIGGMNHFLLPHHVGRERSTRFGTVAVPELVAALLRVGASRNTLVAKVFGGANGIAGAHLSRRLGEENADLAMRLLEEAGIRVLDTDVGGSRGRKLVFLADEGTAWVRQL